MFSEKTARDKDAARFLVESQRGFYGDTYKFLRGLGFKGAITASNWITASPQVLGPLEKYTYTVGDFIDRHGYFGCHSQGERRSGRSATGTPTPTAAPCGSTPSSRASPRRLSTRRWTPATTASPR